MIITRTPYRISFFGGGSDFKEYYSENGGAVLTTTIDKYCYICLRHMPAFLGSKYLVFWSKMEKVNQRADIQHAGVRGCLEYLDIDEGIEINHAGDMPARSGLGSSSAFTVGMLHALHVLRNETIGKEKLADEAIKVEQEVLGETVGIQDQIQCAHGGFNHITFGRDGSYNVNPLSVNKLLENHLVLAYTGIQRFSSEIAEAQVSNVHRKQKQLKRIVEMVPEAVNAMGSMQDFGELLHETWMLKRELSDKITSPEIDELYEKAREHGAIGGKILGAGGGGFMLFLVPPDRRQEMINALGLLTMPVRFENNGTQLILQ